MLRAITRRYLSFEKVLFVVMAIILAILVLAPVAALLYGALQSGSLTSRNRVWTLENLKAVYIYGEYAKPIANTFLIAVPVTLISMVVGVILAWLLTRTNIFLKSQIELALVSQLLISPFVGAIAWTALLGPNTGFLNAAFKSLFGVPLFDIFSLGGVIFVMSLYFIPYVYLFSAAAISSMDPALEEASRISGASSLPTILKVSLPLSTPALVSAAIFIFILACEMFSVPGILGLPAGYTNLAYYLYRSTRMSPPEWHMAAAAGTLLLILAVVGTHFYQRYTRKANRFITVTGKGYRPAIIDLGRARGIISFLVASYAFGTVVLPYGAMVLGSFMKYNSLSITIDVLTTANYTRWLNSELFHVALKNTMLLSILTPVVIVLLAIALSYLIVRTKIRGTSAMDAIAAIPIAIPGIVFGVALVWTYFRVPLPIYGGLGIMILAYVARYLPHGLRTASTTLIQISRELEDAARVSGAGALQAMYSVTVPLLSRAMMYVWMLVFMLVAREVSAAVILYVPNTITLPVLVWDVITGSDVNLAYALATIQTVVILVIAVIGRYLLGVRVWGTGPQLQGGRVLQG